MPIKGPKGTVQEDKSGGWQGHWLFSITNLPPAHYSLKVTSKGFETLSRPDVELQVSQDAEVNNVLTVGQATEVVQVTSAPPMLQAGSTLGRVIGTRKPSSFP